jgi:hypothetical protein
MLFKNKKGLISERRGEERSRRLHARDSFVQDQGCGQMYGEQ